MPNKGYSPTLEHRANLAKAKRGNQNAWLGKKAAYRAVHQWMVRTFGKPDTCEECGRSGLSEHQIHWACIGDWRVRLRKNWKRLCARCHKRYDIKKSKQQKNVYK